MRTLSFAHTSVGACLPAGRVAASSAATREWAWGDGSGAGARVCVLDSGVDPGHPLVGPLAGSFAAFDDGGRWSVRADDSGDPAGHGTACASIIRSLAPHCELTSVRILGSDNRGSSAGLLSGLAWAVEQRFQLISVSLSTRHRPVKEALHDLSDRAYFEGVTIVSSAHNSPVHSYPWRFSSVISVGSHSLGGPERIETNPSPPVEFFGAGARIRVAWPGGGTRVVSGNSFATPHITGMCARILGRHPRFRTTQLRHALSLISDNLEGASR
ncbi:S8 family serine peptidase [Kitasatospora sp. NPDC088783]|uniref:S8 family serine peptidase n=1 Tax=Kitasatospora sp. NPDC088783 TaxID=3364077 RepID=UPI00380F97C1